MSGLYKCRILVVEDDKSISDIIRKNLEDAGYGCLCVYDGQTAADILEKVKFDLALLDIMLPDMDGFQLMDYFNIYKIPVVFLTARADVQDKVKGLKLGAEDYIVKPFEIVELLARVERVLKRYNKTQTILKAYDITVDTKSHVVKNNDEVISLTPKEFKILVLFMQNKNIALFRERIYEEVWEEEYMGDSRTVDLHVQRMRKKTGLEDKIVPVYKIGYRLEADE
ncbi:MAG: response regulator transcription factor [Blautia sp.]|nr:response regulator transcription factor [Blautia sp.]